MKKNILIILLALVAVCLFSYSFANASEIEDQLNDVIDGSLSSIDFNEVDKLANGDFFSSVVSKIRQILNGEFGSAESFFSFILQVLSNDFKNLLPSLVSVLVVCILCGIVTQNKSGLISENTGNLIYFVCFSLVLVLVCGWLFAIYSTIATLLQDISRLTDACMPIMLTLMIANGNNVTASVYQPAIAMFSGTAINLISGVILPLCAFATVFKVISSLSDNIKVTKMSSFLTSAGNWLLGIVFMVFSAFLSVQGLTAASIDGVSIRAAKFATKNYIPILGGYLADGFDLILASSTLIKNAFGVVSLLVMLSIVLSPIVTIVVYNLGLQAVAAICEPITDKRFVDFFSGVSKNLTFLAVLVIAVAFMFFVMVMLAIYTANF